MGRLTKDPELRHTQNDIPVASFSLAVDRNYVKDGKRETDFIDIVAWQRRAEFVSKYFQKGQLVCVEGSLQRRTWTDANDQTRYAYEVIVDSAHFAGYNKAEEFDPFAAEAA